MDDIRGIHFGFSVFPMPDSGIEGLRMPMLGAPLVGSGGPAVPPAT